MYQLTNNPGRTAFANGKEYLFFSGYAYLGLSHVPEFTNLVKEGIDCYGLLFPSSRISNTQLELFQTFENILSKLLGTEDTVSFSSGYLAGQAVVDLVSTDCRHTYAAPHTHPAIKCGEQLPADDWKNHLIKAINQSQAKRFVLFMDAVNPLTATVANFSFLQEIRGDKQLTCIIDDSHGIGLLGPVAEGISYLLPAEGNIDYVITYSLSKALHINGGAVSCSKAFADQLRKLPLYTAATPIMPALAYAFIQGQPIYYRQLKKLQENISDFAAAVADTGGICHHPSLPVFVLKSNWEPGLFSAHNIIISSFAYPDPKGKTINRAVINALHSRQELCKLSSVINRIAQDTT